MKMLTILLLLHSSVFFIKGSDTSAKQTDQPRIAGFPMRKTFLMDFSSGKILYTGSSIQKPSDKAIRYLAMKKLCTSCPNLKR